MADNMTDHTEPSPLWLRILQFPPIRLFLLGYPLFYCLGFSNAFMEQNAGIPVARAVAVLSMVALAMWVYLGSLG